MIPQTTPFSGVGARSLGFASFFTPFFQGLTLGALTTGDIHWVGDRVTTGFFAGWLTPFALTCGLFALALFEFLAATYMTVEMQSQPDLQGDFRLRAIWAETALIPLAIIVFITSKNGAPLGSNGLRINRPNFCSFEERGQIGKPFLPAVEQIMGSQAICQLLELLGMTAQPSTHQASVYSER